MQGVSRYVLLMTMSGLCFTSSHGAYNNFFSNLDKHRNHHRQASPGNARPRGTLGNATHGVPSHTHDQQMSNASRLSSFTCTGVRWGEANQHGCIGCRTCRFDNVCVNHTTSEIQFYKGSNDSVLFYHHATGEPFFQFPKDLVDTGHSSIAGDKPLWGPKAVPGAVPQNAPFSTAPVAAYVSLNDYPGNFGHALYDFLFPVFNILQLMNLYDPDFQLLLAEHQGANPGVLHDFLQNPKADRSMLPLITRRQAVPIHDFGAHASKHDGHHGLTCFSSLVAGTAQMATSSQRVRTLPFRTAAFSNLGIVETHQRSAPRITMLKKKGKRRVENADDVMLHLQSRFQGAEFETLEGEEIAVMGLKDQLEAMSRTDILITPCGGIGTVLTFLPPGATAIVMNFWQSVTETSIQMESIYYWNLEFLDIQYFPVLLEDYDLSSDRPECEKPEDDPYFEEQGALIHCNIHLKNLERLENVVKNALQAWTIRNSKHSTLQTW